MACRGQVQPVTVQSKAVEKPERFRDLRNPTFPSRRYDYVEAAIMLDYNDRDVAAPRGGVSIYIFKYIF